MHTELVSKATNSEMEWGVTSSMTSLEEVFNSKYRKFSGETDFREQCKLLLDLFKLQIVFAGMSYE